MDWTSLLPLTAIGLMCFPMMRNGGCCGGGGHPPPPGKPKDQSNSDEATSERNPTNRP